MSEALVDAVQSNIPNKAMENPQYFAAVLHLLVINVTELPSTILSS